MSIDAEEEGLGGSFCSNTHPRTAVGVTTDGKLVVATVDGRQSISKGMSLPQLAELMKSQGCVEAINLDGGGSTTMATSFGVLNSPSDGSERLIANSLAFLAKTTAGAGKTAASGAKVADSTSDSGPKRPGSKSSAAGSARKTDPDGFSIAPAPGPIQTGQVFQFALLDATTGQPLDAVTAGKAVWATTGAVGFVDQSGRLFAGRPRKGAVVAKLGAAIVSTPVEVIDTIPVVDAQWQPDPSGDPNKNVLLLTAADTGKSPLKGRKLGVSVTGGTADQTEVTTGDDGKAAVTITWDAGTGGGAQVQVTGENMEPVTLKRPEQTPGESQPVDGVKSE